MRYALLRDNKNEKEREWGNETPPDLSHKIGYILKWVPINERGARPAYDEGTHAAPMHGDDIITDTAVTKTWDAAIALTQEELDAAAKKVPNYTPPG